MNSNHRLFVPFSTLLLVLLACDEPNEPTSTREIPLEFKVIGITGATKTYDLTVADLIEGTETPFIVPPDSFTSILQFPDTLYNKGIFIYGQTTDDCTFESDTFRVEQKEIGYNLFSIIYSWYLNHRTNGFYSTTYIDKYVLENDNRLYQAYDTFKELLYQLPLRVGSIQTSPYSGAVISVESLDTIATQAGVFAAYRVEVFGRWSPDHSETHFVSPDVGPVLTIRRLAFTYSVPWDTSNVQRIIQIQRRELVGIQYH